MPEFPEREDKRQARRRPSTTGGPNPQAEMSTWRKKLQLSRLKFDDVAKDIFLAELSCHGRKGDAAAAAGVTAQTVRDHAKIDPEFAEALEVALESYRDLVVDHAQDLLLNGTIVRRFDQKGHVVEERVEYPIALLLAELKRVDHSYRDKAGAPEPAAGENEDDPTVGGVILLPADMDEGDWIREQMAKNATRTPPEGAEPD